MKEDKHVVIAHCHMFKNAGSTLDWSLKRNFGKMFLDHHDDARMRVGGQDFLAHFLGDHPELKAISSHHLQFPLSDRDEALQIMPAMLIRHPIDRVGSVYGFEKMQRADTPGAIHAKKMFFAEYVTWRMQPTVGTTIRNFQTLVLLGQTDQPNQLIDDVSFTRLKAFLYGAPLLGLVELYDESMVLFEQELRPFFSGIDLSYVMQNITPGRRQSLDERVAEVHASLDDATMELLLARNQRDLELYFETKKIVHGRIAKMAHFDHLLSDFRSRCQLSSVGS